MVFVTSLGVLEASSPCLPGERRWFSTAVRGSGEGAGFGWSPPVVWVPCIHVMGLLPSSPAFPCCGLESGREGNLVCSSKAQELPHPSPSRKQGAEGESLKTTAGAPSAFCVCLLTAHYSPTSRPCERPSRGVLLKRL